jgi:hypothetical protein
MTKGKSCDRDICRSETPRCPLCRIKFVAYEGIICKDCLPANCEICGDAMTYTYRVGEYNACGSCYEKRMYKAPYTACKICKKNKKTNTRGVCVECERKLVL